MVKYLSGRVPKNPQDKITDDRYQYLGIEQAEPNLGDPNLLSFHTPSAATYDPNTGVLTLTVNDHKFFNGDTIKIADNSLSFSCNYGSGEHTYNGGTSTNAITITAGSVQRDVTNAIYDPLAGIATLTIGTHSFTTSDTVTIGDNKLSFTCTADNNQTSHTYPRATDPVSGIATAITAVTGTTITVGVGTVASSQTKTYPRSTDPISGKFVQISGVTANTFSLQVLDTIPSTNLNPHVFVSSSNNSVQRRSKYVGINNEAPPIGDQYQIISVPGHPGRRYWVPKGGGLVPGAISIYDEGVLVGTADSITQLNFVGAAVTAAAQPLGIAATMTIIPATVQDEPPISPKTGELWWESDTGDLFIYYDDGTSAQWVLANAGGLGNTGDKGSKGEVGPTGGQKGQKGEVGDKGQKGQKGEKGTLGQKGVAGDVEAQGNKGQKGEVGDKGQKGQKGTTGDKGQKGQKGEVGDKGQKGQTGDVEAQGNKGQKGQKGEVGEKGQKGTTGDKGQKGEVGDKGQKGEVGEKGQKGQDGNKGQKGEVGFKGQKGEQNDKGQKGQTGADNSTKGQKGEQNDKGQKGEVGDKGQKGEGQKGQQGGGAPVGQIVAWSGSAGSLPSGYFLCDGSAVSRTTYAPLYTIVGTAHGSGNGSTTFNIPDLRDKFIVGASNSTGDITYPGVSPAATGGSADAVVVTHEHTTNIDGGHVIPGNGGSTYAYGGAGTYNSTVFNMDPEGVSGTNKNLPPYYALAYIIQYAQGGDVAKGQKGEDNSTKGQKGADNSTKGSKGEPSTIKGQKGEPSSQAGPPGPPGSNTFLNLSDVDPSSYSSQAGKTVKVNSSENGLEFTSFPSSPAASVPSGSVMVFYQSSAPTGWTKSTSNNNKALRVVSGSGGGTGGNNSFTSTFENKSISVSGSGTASISISVSGTTGTIPSRNIGHLNVVTDQHTSVLADLPSHNHQYHAPIGSSGGQYGFLDTGNSGSSGQPNTNSRGSNGSHHHAIYLHPLGSHDHSGATFSGSGSDSDTVSVSSSGTVDLRVQYIDVIICSKN